MLRWLLDEEVFDKITPDPVGVDGTCERLERAVKGVGALICDFLGVSGCTLLRCPAPKEEDDRGVRDEVDPAVLDLRPTMKKGCRRAVCGLIRLSGSHIKHLAMKSTKFSSSQ